MKYLFWPISFLMVNLNNFKINKILFHNIINKGVNVDDCQAVSKLIGYKIFLNEFVAYQKLGNIIDFRNKIIANNTIIFYKNGTLPLPNSLDMIWNV
jgi:nucleoside permease NupC